MTAAENAQPPMLRMGVVREHLDRYVGLAGELSVVSYLDWTGRRFPCTPDGTQHAAEYVRDLDMQGATGIYHRGTTMREDAPRHGRGKVHHSAVWPRVQFDIDFRDELSGKLDFAPDMTTARALVASAGLPPTTGLIDSGHGLYPVWEFDAPVQDSTFMRQLNRDVHALLTARFAAAGYRLDKGVTDGARVWRIPGTVNRKHEDAPVVARVVEWTSARTSPSVLRQLVPHAEGADLSMDGAVTLAQDVQTGVIRPARTFTMDQAMSYVDSEGLSRLRAAQSGDRNRLLYEAACVFGHFISGGFLPMAKAVESLLVNCPPGWDEPMPVRLSTIQSGFRFTMPEPYVLVAPLVLTDSGPAPQPLSAGPGLEMAGVAQATPAPAPVPPSEQPQWTPEEIDESALRERVRKLDLDQRARDFRASRDAPPLQVLGGGAFLDAPEVEWLVPGMLWRTGTSRVFGPPGGTKSFLLLDLALSLATGGAWFGMALQRTKVHFVMAEGQGVNVTRAKAWLRHHGVPAAELEGWFTAIPQGVTLTPAGVEQYARLVADERPGLIILDTKARMMVGNPNSSEDAAVVVRAMDALKESSGGCILLVDHTGVHDTSRAKGDNAILGAMDTEVRVDWAEGGGVAAAEVTRDKTGGMARWIYRLAPVEQGGLQMPGKVTPAVVVPVQDGPVAESPLSSTERWHDLDALTAPVPDAVAEALRGAKGRTAGLDVFRLLQFVGGDSGMTKAEIVAGLNEGPRDYPRSQVYAAVGRLIEKGVMVRGSTDSRWLLAPEYGA